MTELLGELPWLIGLDDDLPGAALLRARVRRPVVLDPSITARWPVVDGPAGLYAPMRVVTRMARHRPLAHAVLDDYARLRCSSYYLDAYRFLGRVAVIVPFAALASFPASRVFGERVFVRPDSNFKLFAGEVVACSGLADFAARYAHHADELVVLAEVIGIEREYRCFIADGMFVTGSSYPQPPYLSVPDEVRGFALEVAAAVAPRGVDPLTVDVAVTAAGPRLVEIGGVHSWGLYGADVAAFVTMIETAARDRWSP